jgi:hypothetical protein
MWAERALQRAEPGAYLVKDQIRGEPWAGCYVLVLPGSLLSIARAKDGEGDISIYFAYFI